jgi:hypothetical protein
MGGPINPTSTPFAYIYIYIMMAGLAGPPINISPFHLRTNKLAIKQERSERGLFACERNKNVGIAKMRRSPLQA